MSPNRIDDAYTPFSFYRKDYDMIAGREPALFMGLIQAVLAVAISFGLNVTNAQMGLILAAFAALVSVYVRSQVSPVVDTTHTTTTR